MAARVLVDTNVLVYAYDVGDAAKQRRAVNVLDGLIHAGTGVLCAQVLAEFYVTITRKLDRPLEPKEAYERVQSHAMIWPVLALTPGIVLEAARGVRDHTFSYWDAQIWAFARLNQIGYVFSEDFAPGSVVDGVQFVNPFSSDFELSAWSAMH